MKMTNEWRRVIATHEEIQQTASGPWPGNNYPGVALPCRDALGKWIILRKDSLWTCAKVVDLGPWCQDDYEYVFNGERPRAEEYKGRYCPLRKGSLALATVPDGNGGMKGVSVCNGAGIDILPEVANELDIKINDNVMLEWKFLEL